MCIKFYLYRKCTVHSRTKQQSRGQSRLFKVFSCTLIISVPQNSLIAKSFLEVPGEPVAPKGIALPNDVIKVPVDHNFSIIIQNIITSNGVKERSSQCRRQVSLLNLSPSNVCIARCAGAAPWPRRSAVHQPPITCNL